MTDSDRYMCSGKTLANGVTFELSLALLALYRNLSVRRQPSLRRMAWVTFYADCASYHGRLGLNPYQVIDCFGRGYSHLVRAKVQVEALSLHRNYGAFIPSPKASVCAQGS